MTKPGMSPTGRTKAKVGVRRGRYSSGAIFVNGHQPYSTQTRDKIVAFLRSRGRGCTVGEVAAALCYSRGHIRNVMAAMAKDGVIVVQYPAISGTYPIIYGVEGGAR